MSGKRCGLLKAVNDPRVQNVRDSIVWSNKDDAMKSPMSTTKSAVHSHFENWRTLPKREPQGSYIAVIKEHEDEEEEDGGGARGDGCTFKVSHFSHGVTMVNKDSSSSSSSSATLADPRCRCQNAQWSLEAYQSALDLYDAFNQCTDSYIQPFIQDALHTLDHAYRLYGPESVVGSFNGGRMPW
jgi:hypothetical protein